MNRSFENIFEKYNISCETPRKRLKTVTHSTVGKSFLSLKKRPTQNNGSNCNQSFNKSCNSNTSYFLKTKGKYCYPTRYKTLDVIRLKNVHKHFNGSLTSNSSFSDNLNVSNELNDKENFDGQNSLSSSMKTFDMQLNYSTNECKEDDGKMNVISNSYDSIVCIGNDTKSFNIGRSKESSENPVHDKRCKRLNTTFIEKEEVFNTSLNNADNILMDRYHQSLENSFMNTSNTEDSNTLHDKPSENKPTELDLLIDLIEQEEKTDKQIQKHIQNKKFQNCDDNLPRTKSCLKGGYEEMFQRGLKLEKVKSNFLKHDKKMGLRCGQLLTIVNVETSYGLTLATVKTEDFDKNFAVVVSQEIASRLKEGAQIEAFFDDNTIPYKLQINSEWLDVYLEPYKLLIH